LLTLRAFVAGTVLVAALPAWCSDAEGPGAFRAPWWGPEASVVYAGFYGLRGPPKWEDAFVGLEIRGGRFWWELHLNSGALAASDGNAFVYLGVLADVPIGDVVHLVLSFAPGISSSGTDHYLGNPLIFRSTAEVSFTIAERTRLGVSFSHMSNGKLAAPNPGVETLSLTLTVLALPY
jgi:Lipid A 3-O-deacylase (PagL)